MILKRKLGDSVLVHSGRPYTGKVVKLGREWATVAFTCANGAKKKRKVRIVMYLP